jgi:para-nitrobenzyl esterase
MKRSNSRILCTLLILLGVLAVPGVSAADRVKTSNGILESTPAPKDGVRSFKGIPFAQPPIGDLRWRDPQPVKSWKGVRKAGQFGPRCMQTPNPAAAHWFRGNGMSEDCLYLNVWAPAKASVEKLPVLVLFPAGGFQHGDASEPRVDGESMARKGIVVVSTNYRLNIFGYFVHPELTKESPHAGPGNYGLLDLVAALQWIQKNIAAFGGDPKHITIAGESAGSIAVSGLMASPLSRNLIAGAIGESGSLLSNFPPLPRATIEQSTAKVIATAGTSSLAALRAMTAEQLLEVLIKASKGASGDLFRPLQDGYFLPKPITEIYEAGEQAQIPLLVGSNTQDGRPSAVLGNNSPTPQTLADAIKKLYGDQAGPVLKVYAASNREEVYDAAAHLASARFISYGSWRLAELQTTTGSQPVYRFLFAHPRPAFIGLPGQSAPAISGGSNGGAQQNSDPPGAVHSSGSHYSLGNLDADKRYGWKADDYEVSRVMQAYWVNFIKTGNPNGLGLPEWPPYRPDNDYQRMRIDVKCQAGPEKRERYLALEAVTPKP